MTWKKLITPLDDGAISGLRVFDQVLISGTVYTARDLAHREIMKLHSAGAPLPFDPAGAVLYYAGPAPRPPHRVIGSSGPTTSSRMDPFTGIMMDIGFRGFIGKGPRSAEVHDLMKRHGSVYFTTYGGAGAYLSMKITAAEVVLFPELGPEAVYRLEFSDFPAIVAIDSRGKTLCENAV